MLHRVSRTDCFEDQLKFEKLFDEYRRPVPLLLDMCLHSSRTRRSKFVSII